MRRRVRIRRYPGNRPRVEEIPSEADMDLFMKALHTVMLAFGGPPAQTLEAQALFLEEIKVASGLTRKRVGELAAKVAADLAKPEFMARLRAEAKRRGIQ